MIRRLLSPLIRSITHRMPRPHIWLALMDDPEVIYGPRKIEKVPREWFQPSAVLPKWCAKKADCGRPSKKEST